MLNFFKSKPSSYLGVDIGTNSIKLVELEGISGRPRLVTYGIVEVDTDIARSDDKEKDERDQHIIASAVKSLILKSNARSSSAVAALPNFSVFSSVISLPKLSDKQIAEAVQWEAKKFVPMPIENVVLDWKILTEAKRGSSGDGAAQAKADPDNGNNKNNGSENGNLAKCDTVMSVLLTAAPRHLIERYVSIFKLSGLNLLSLETESFALARSLVGNEEGVILIADVGSLTTDVTVSRFGVPVFSRSINVGGKTITQAIADSMGVAIERAEQFKRDVGIGPSQPGVDSKGVVKVIEQAFSSVISEMKYTLELQGNQGRSVEKVLLTGGSSLLPSLDRYISASLGVKVFIANPWSRVSYPRDLEDVLGAIAPRMGVAVGLAMREIE